MHREFRDVWEALRAQYHGRKDKLRLVSIKGLRGIEHLQVEFTFPVTVLAGPNGCGKSTILFALACAYRPEEAGPRDFVPSTMFPDFRGSSSLPRDDRVEVEIEFDYLVGGQPRTMRWRRRKSWNRSGFPGGKAPVRDVYLRTLANLTNPSEVRGLLQLARKKVEPQPVDVADLQLAHTVLDWRYRRTVHLRSSDRDLLYVERTQGGSYSEFHMSAGERSVLRLSLELSRRRNALVLIDEVEAGLHPATQQLLMLQLERLALRNNLQVVVATHSPTILESVPSDALIFLERHDGQVVVRPTYRHVLQHALYGMAMDRLTVLCEDEAAEAVVTGILEVLGPRIDLRPGDVEIGRDSGKAEFKSHVTTLAKARLLWKTVFVLDGDARALEPELRSIAQTHGQALHLLFLPGRQSPEEWAMDCLQRHAGEYAEALGFTEQDLLSVVERERKIAESALGRPAEKMKAVLARVAQQAGRRPSDLLRLVAHHEAAQQRGEIGETVSALQDALESWAQV